MEQPDCFPIDFQSISDIQLPDILDTESPEETKYYVQITLGGKRAYRCTAPDCGKIYRFKSEADRHAVMHQDDRPYCCNFIGCKKTFKRPETLEDHVRLHEGSLPFPCDKAGCDKRFASKPALRYHRLLHKNNRKFKCDLEDCEKSFLTASQLKQHQRALHPNKAVLYKSEYKPFKIIRTEPKRRSGSDVGTKLSESIHWEMRTQKWEKASSEEMILEILAENRVLKEKLDKHEKVKSKGSLEKKIQMSLEYASLVPPQKEAEPSLFFDSYELNLLDFLKEQ